MYRYSTKSTVLGVALLLCLQFIVTRSLSNQDEGPTVPSLVVDRACMPFNKSSGMAELCGYNFTVDILPSLRTEEFKIADFLIHQYSDITTSRCLKTQRLLYCANFFPRCVSDVRGPYLPCRRVCLDHIARCGEEIRNSSERNYWATRFACNVLPEKDDPSSKDYRKRCFEPPDFKPCNSKCSDVEPLKCFPLVAKECQNFGYSFTIFPEKVQKGFKVWTEKHQSPSCTAKEKRFTCSSWFPPCYKDKLFGSTCQEDCLDFIRSGCQKNSSAIHQNEEQCLNFPKRSSPNTAFCKRTQWIANWPAEKNGQFKQNGNPALILIGLLSSTVTWLFRLALL